VFDPMAVMFVISYNVALQHTHENKKTLSGTEKKKKWEVYGENKKKEPIELKPDSKDLPNIENKKETIGRGGISGKK